MVRGGFDGLCGVSCGKPRKREDEEEIVLSLLGL